MYTDTSAMDAECQLGVSVSLDESEPLLHQLMRDFVARVNACPDKPTAEQFAPVKKGYGRLLKSMTPDELKEFWGFVTEAKRNGGPADLLAFVRFSKLRTYVFHQTDKYKMKKAAYDKAAKNDPKRREQIKAAKAKYRENKRKGQLQ